MFLEGETLTKQQKLLVKTIGSKLKCAIPDSILTVIANMVSLAKAPTLYLILQHLHLASDAAVLYISKHYIFNLSTFN